MTPGFKPFTEKNCNILLTLASANFIHLALPALKLFSKQIPVLLQKAQMADFLLDQPETGKEDIILSKKNLWGCP